MIFVVRVSKRCDGSGLPISKTIDHEIALTLGTTNSPLLIDFGKIIDGWPSLTRPSSPQAWLCENRKSKKCQNFHSMSQQRPPKSDKFDYEIEFTINTKDDKPQFIEFKEPWEGSTLLAKIGYDISQKHVCFQAIVDTQSLFCFGRMKSSLGEEALPIQSFCIHKSNPITLCFNVASEEPQVFRFSLTKTENPFDDFSPTDNHDDFKVRETLNTIVGHILRYFAENDNFIKDITLKSWFESALVDLNSVRLEQLYAYLNTPDVSISVSSARSVVSATSLSAKDYITFMVQQILGTDAPNNTIVYGIDLELPPQIVYYESKKLHIPEDRGVPRAEILFAYKADKLYATTDIPNLSKGDQIFHVIAPTTKRGPTVTFIQSVNDQKDKKKVQIEYDRFLTLAINSTVQSLKQPMMFKSVKCCDTTFVEMFKSNEYNFYPMLSYVENRSAKLILSTVPSNFILPGVMPYVIVVPKKDTPTSPATSAPLFKFTKPGNVVYLTIANLKPGDPYAQLHNFPGCAYITAISIANKSLESMGMALPPANVFDPTPDDTKHSPKPKVKPKRRH